MNETLCAESVIGAHDADGRGRCRWCGLKVAPGVRRPRSLALAQLSREAAHEDTTRLGEAYAYMFDPDWGA